MTGEGQPGPDDAGFPPPSLTGDEAEPRQRCDFCRMPLPAEPIEQTIGEWDHRFCTATCRDALAETDRVFTEYHGFRRIDPGVSAMDRALPQGMPRNSFVLLSGQAGTRGDALGAELIWRTLERDEPAVVVTFTEPPVSLLQRFMDLEWNVLPALADDRLHIVDCFTTRLEDQDRFRRRFNDWNRHLDRIASPRLSRVNSPSDPAEVRNKIDNALESLGMVDRGSVYLDSLTEFGSLVQPIQAYRFVKDLRADICKGRFVPVFGGGTVTGEGEEFPHDLGYIVDGIVDLAFTDGLVEDTLLRRIRVRKMNGVLVITEWQVYEFTSTTGLVTFDPTEELAEASEE